MDYEKAYKNLVAKVKNAHLFAQTDSTKNVLEDILPELRESEDERARKAALEGIEYLERKLGWDAIGDTDILDVKEYLEKQKEQKQTDLPAGFYFIDMDGKRYYSKEFRYGDMKLKVAEQKPAECIEDSVKFEEGFKAGRESGLRDGQKYVLNNLDSYGLCKPAEWSEEDEHRRQQAINALDRNGYYVLVDWLKSLRPAKQEWSEEDERMVKFYEDDYNNNLGDMPMRDVIENRIKFKDWLLNRLKSIRPSWKPSEEQMRCLCDVVDEAIRKCNLSTGGYQQARILESLYMQLQKL